VQDCSHGFDVSDVAFNDSQELGLDFWADSFGGQGGLEFLGRARKGCACVFVAQAGGEAVAGAVACGAEEGGCAGCRHFLLLSRCCRVLQFEVSIVYYAVLICRIVVMAASEVDGMYICRWIVAKQVVLCGGKCLWMYQVSFLDCELGDVERNCQRYLYIKS
jgi:hypothetical protein